MAVETHELVRWFDDVDAHDLAAVGGKNASLGELMRHLTARGVRVPPGFATTAVAYRRFLASAELDRPIAALLADLDGGKRSLAAVGAAIRRLMETAPLPRELSTSIRDAYRELGRRTGAEAPAVAVRSSATAEDLPQASFAGQLESFLNVRGEEALLVACRSCFASLYTDRALFYRREHGFDDLDIALSVGVQVMVRSDLGAAGVMFTLDTESGFPGVVHIDSAWGLGEAVVQGTVRPDEFVVFKELLDDPSRVPILERRLGAKETKVVYAEPDATAVSRVGATRTVAAGTAERAELSLVDEDVLTLARWAKGIEEHYGRPMDIEWARDGETGELFVVQARPETVHSRRGTRELATYTLTEHGERLLTGIAIGNAITAGPVAVLESPRQLDRLPAGGVLVSRVTDPDWVVAMRRAAGIVTDEGGRTSHAAIVSRELGIPAIVGTGRATEVLAPGQEVTLSCAEGDEGVVYAGRLAFDTHELDLENLPSTRTRVQMNIADPQAALGWWRLPAHGVGLLRMESIIANLIRVHPMALARFDHLPEGEERDRIEELTRGYTDRGAYFVDRLASGVGLIAASRWPDPVLLRMSDFKTNEYARLLGGSGFEPYEENPMLGWRGASRYYDEGYAAGFALECAAVHRVRASLGFRNVHVMIPFCRTVEEADRVLDAMVAQGLERGEPSGRSETSGDALQIWVMCEIPSNVILAEEFAARFDGFSIGSNDLTQLLLGVDRDAARLATLFDERNEAVTRTIRDLIARAHASGRPVGFCGQAPSDRPEYAAFLVEAGIDSISVTPDRVLPTLRAVAEAEARLAARSNASGADTGAEHETAEPVSTTPGGDL